jgi:hypothetical protein
LGKGIKCTTTKMQSVKAPNRTGRRIEEAKAMAEKVGSEAPAAMSSVRQAPAAPSTAETMQIWSEQGVNMHPDGQLFNDFATLNAAFATSLDTGGSTAMSALSLAQYDPFADPLIPLQMMPDGHLRARPWHVFDQVGMQSQTMDGTVARHVGAPMLPQAVVPLPFDSGAQAGLVKGALGKELVR